MRKMMMLAAIAAFLATLALAAQPNHASGDKHAVPDKQPPAPVTTYTYDSNCCTTQAPQKPNEKPHRWYTSLEDPNWWLVIVASLTGGFIGWQAWETRNAAEATARSIDVSKTKERAKLVIRTQRLNLEAGAVPAAKIVIANVGETTAVIGFAGAGLHLSHTDNLGEEDSGYYALKVMDGVLAKGEQSEETVWWPGHLLYTYLPEDIKGDNKMTIHLHGWLTYRDAFDDWWDLKFHFTWIQYPFEIYMPNLDADISGDWDNRKPNSERRIENPMPKRWLQFWRKSTPLPKPPIPN